MKTHSAALVGEKSFCFTDTSSTGRTAELCRVTYMNDTCSIGNCVESSFSQTEAVFSCFAPLVCVFSYCALVDIILAGVPSLNGVMGNRVLSFFHFASAQIIRAPTRPNVQLVSVHLF